MLLHLQIKNFKLLRDVELEFSPDVPTVFIGTNSSGKSTILEVLDFLSRCATDGIGEALVAHGGFSAVRTIGATGPIELSTMWAFANGPEESRRLLLLSWTFSFDASAMGQIYVRSESLFDQTTALVRTDDEGRRMVYDESDLDATPSPINHVAKLAFEALVDDSRYPALGLLRAVVRGVRVLGALAAAPPWARISPERASARDAMIISTYSFVGREGVGLATALYNLQTEHADAWNTLQRAFIGEFPFVKRIVFPPDPGGSRISIAIEDRRFAGRRIYASELSDGMVALLCLLSLILHPDQTAVLALDEPDAHLHPSAIRRLLAFAGDPHRRRNMILVTHSNAVLDELDDPASSIRVVESTPTGARVRKLDAEALAAWRKEYTMSELRQTGHLDPSNGSYGSDE